MSSSYGTSIRLTEYSLEEGCAFTNHGSYGFVPNAVESERARLVAQMNSNPDRFFRFTKLQEWSENLQAVCEYLTLPFENSVFVDNTTSGANDILKSFSFRPGDKILTTNLIYGAVHYISEAVAIKSGGEVVDFPIRFPVESTQSLVARFDAAFEENNGRVRVAVIEAIASFSAARLPVRELVEVARRHKAVVIVDAAHTCGQLLNEEVRELYELGDFFVASLHKWMFTARPVGILCVKPEFVDQIQPAITSWGYAYRSKNLHSLFMALGTKDYTPFFTLKAALKFRKRMDSLEDGGIRKHNHDLVERAADQLANQIGTAQLRYASNDSDNAKFKSPFMREIFLPDVIQTWIKSELPSHSRPVDVTSKSEGKTYWLPGTDESIATRLTKLMRVLYEKYHVVATIVDIDTAENSPLICVRISSQIYNSMSDYERLGNALLDVVEMIKSGEMDKL